MQWRADRDGVALKFPPAHPFNPLAALRLCIAAGSSADAVEAIFAHLWREGREGDTPECLSDVAAALGISRIEAALARPEVKAKLRANFEAALADGVFGVPSTVARGEVFWGKDATLMFEDWLDDPVAFESDALRALRALPEGARRA